MMTQPKIDSKQLKGVPQPFGGPAASGTPDDLAIEKLAGLGAGPESESPPLAQTSPLPAMWSGGDFGAVARNDRHQALASVSATDAWIQEPSPVGAIGDLTGEATVPAPGSETAPQHEPQAGA